MGNKSTRVFVDEKYTRPQGLYDFKDLDYRRLRRLILNGQLAPCFPGADERTSELDECPICFLFYPSLNRSRCCSKAICTECYLQLKETNFTRSVQCPYCKTPSYAVEFRGAKTAEEKGVEQAEEQKVIEAKIRMHQRELRDDAERVKRLAAATQAEPLEHEGNYTSMEPGMSAQPAQMQGSLPGLSRTEQFDLDENMMLMEALLVSIQEQGPTHEKFDLAQHIRAELAERQAIRAERQGDDRIENRVLESGRSLIANCNERRGLTIRSCSMDPLRRGVDVDGGILQKEKQDVICENWRNGERSLLNASRSSDDELNGWSDDDTNPNFSWSSIHGVGGGFAFDLGYRVFPEAVEGSTSFPSRAIPSAPEMWETLDGFRLSQSSDDGSGEMRLSSASGSMPSSLTFEDQMRMAIELSLADARAEGWETLIRNARHL